MLRSCWYAIDSAITAVVDVSRGWRPLTDGRCLVRIAVHRSARRHAEAVPASAQSALHSRSVSPRRRTRRPAARRVPPTSLCCFASAAPSAKIRRALDTGRITGKAAPRPTRPPGRFGP
jgi:hypothetical protein